MQDLNFTLNKATLDETIADKLEEIILRDSAQVEQKLPSEQSLAISFGVSRTVIREALKLLKARGLITSQNGVGSSIRKPDPSSVTDAIKRIIHLENINSMCIFEARAALETMAARLAAEKATPADCDVLEEINQKMEACKEDIEKRVQADIQFHQKFAEIAGNPLISLFIESLSPMLAPLLTQNMHIPHSNEDGIIYHKHIIAALRTGDVAKVEDAVRSHIVTSMKNYEASLEEKKTAQ